MKTILILLEMKNAIRILLGEEYKGPALLNIYVFIDICASLNFKLKTAKTKNSKIFKTYLEKYINPWTKSYTVCDLWAARSSLIHSLSPLGDHTKRPGNTTPIFYYSWPEIKEGIELIIKSKGYERFHLLDVKEIFDLAIEAFNNFHRDIEINTEFEEIVLQNAKDILEDMRFYRLEEEINSIEDYKKLIKVESIADQPKN